MKIEQNKQIKIIVNFLLKFPDKMLCQNKVPIPICLKLVKIICSFIAGAMKVKFLDRLRALGLCLSLDNVNQYKKIAFRNERTQKIQV